MARRLALVGFVLVTTLTLMAQTPANLPPPSRTIELYDGVAPGSEHWDWQEHTFVTLLGNTVTRNVVAPTLQYYPAAPRRVGGPAVIIAPGGGFTDLMINYEGIRTAAALNALGVDAFILKYRLIYTDPSIPLPWPGDTPPPRTRQFDEQGTITGGPQAGQNIFQITQADARRAIVWLREHAEELGVAPDQIGIIGFSAGAFVSLALAIDEPLYRPDFAGVIYGPDHRDAAIPADVPPLFVAVSSDDAWSAARSINLFQAWRAAQRPAELHVFQMGAHGFLNTGGGADHFMDRFAEWMRANAWLEPSAGGTGPLYR